MPGWQNSQLMSLILITRILASGSSSEEDYRQSRGREDYTENTINKEQTSEKLESKCLNSLRMPLPLPQQLLLQRGKHKRAHSFWDVVLVL
jgi:hypothetical protein